MPVTYRELPITEEILLANWIYGRRLFGTSEIYEEELQDTECHICSYFGMRYKESYHEELFKPYYEGMVSEDQLIAAIKEARLSILYWEE